MRRRTRRDRRVVAAHGVESLVCPLWDHPVAFIGRLSFDSPGGPSSSPPNGTVIVGVGVDVDRFAEVFSQFDPVVVRVSKCYERVAEQAAAVA